MTPLPLSLFLLLAWNTDIMAGALAAVSSHDAIIKLEVKHRKWWNELDRKIELGPR